MAAEEYHPLAGLAIQHQFKVENLSIQPSLARCTYLDVGWRVDVKGLNMQLWIISATVSVVITGQIESANTSVSVRMMPVVYRYYHNEEFVKQLLFIIHNSLFQSMTLALLLFLYLSCSD